MRWFIPIAYSSPCILNLKLLLQSPFLPKLYGVVFRKFSFLKTYWKLEEVVTAGSSSLASFQANPFRCNLIHPSFKLIRAWAAFHFLILTLILHKFLILKLPSVHLFLVLLLLYIVAVVVDVCVAVPVAARMNPLMLFKVKFVALLRPLEFWSPLVLMYLWWVFVESHKLSKLHSRISQL